MLKNIQSCRKFLVKIMYKFHAYLIFLSIYCEVYVIYVLLRKFKHVLVQEVGNE